MPQIFAWPGVIPPGSTTAVLTSSIDLFPTICAAAEAEPPEPVDGLDLSPLFRGDASAFDHRALYWHFPHYRDDFPYSIVRSGDWKLVRWYADNRTSYDLRDLAADPAETQDLSESRPDKRLELETLMDRFGAATTARLPRGIPPLTYDQWLWGHFHQVPPDQRAPTDDPNGNGATNAEEFIGGGSPGAANETPPLRPSLQLDGPQPSFHFSIDQEVSPALVLARWSDDLVSWETDGLVVDPVSGPPGFLSFRCRPVGNPPKAFFQLQIEP